MLQAIEEVFVGGGEMGERMRALDWSRTPLGPVESWPQSLRTAVGIVLGTRHPMLLLWGPDLIQFYNDAFGHSLGTERHATALAQRARECWAEIWDQLEPQFDAIMSRGEATWQEDHLVPITRGEGVEDVYWSYSYSPVWAEERQVGGILVTVQETTRRVLAERRSRVLRDLAARRPGSPSERDVLGAAVEALREAPRDLPFAALYVRDERGALGLAGQVGPNVGAGGWPESLPPGDPRARMLASALEAVEPILVEDLTAVPGAAAAAAADLSPRARSALLLPVPRGESAVGAAGVLVAGLSSRLPLDREYRDFLRAVAAQIGLSLVAVRADEASHRRAEVLGAEVARLAELLDRAPGFLAVLRGPDHVFEVVNPGYRALVGDRALIGRPVAEALPELRTQGYIELLDRVLATGEPYRGAGAAVRLQAGPGEPAAERFLDFIYQRIEGAGGAPPGIFAYGFDVTERHEAERALAASERRYRLLVESIPQVVWIADAEGRLEYVSPSASRPVSSDPALTLEDRLARTLHPADAERAIASWREAVRTEAPFEVEVRVRRADGAERWMLVRAAPFREEDAGPRWFGTATDIDDLKRAEEQLRDAQRMQAVGTLAGGVAHEINNQMTAVLGFGEFVLRALGPDHPQAPDMRVMLRSAERAARISQQLLAFSRQQVTERRDLDLAALVLELQPVLTQLLGSDKRLTVTGPAGSGAALPIVWADPDQVQQVLVNLVANARDATDTGASVAIRLRDVHLDAPRPAPLGETVPPGRYVLLTVTDTGHGMTPEVLARIFDPFFTTKEVGAGTGLGLSMVHGTLRRHGGYVRAESAPGGGTTVELYWPVSESTVREDAATPDRPRAARAPRRVEVLVVEDEPNVRGLAARALREAGYDVEEAADGGDALAAIERAGGPPDVLVTDVIMPQVNGRQLFDAVRGHWPALPVLFISGHTGESDIYRRMVPADAPFLQKPFTPDGLVSAVASLVGAGERSPG